MLGLNTGFPIPLCLELEPCRWPPSKKPETQSAINNRKHCFVNTSNASLLISSAKDRTPSTFVPVACAQYVAPQHTQKSAISHSPHRTKKHCLLSHSRKDRHPCASMLWPCIQLPSIQPKLLSAIPTAQTKQESMLCHVSNACLLALRAKARAPCAFESLASTLYTHGLPA